MSECSYYLNVSWFITFYLNVNEDEEKDSRHWYVKILYSLYISELEWKRYIVVLNFQYHHHMICIYWKVEAGNQGQF